MEDKAKTTVGATIVIEVGVNDMVGMLLSLVGAAPVKSSLPPRGRFWEKVQQAEDQVIG